MKILGEFKEFATRGNVIDMSIGVIIGTTFAKIVQSFVDDVLMPPIGLLIGKVDFSNLYVSLTKEHFPTFAEAQAAGAPTVNYGIFLNHVIHFMIVAFVLFLFVKQMNKLRRPEDEKKTKACPWCFTDIAIHATRCPNCTSLLEEKAVHKTTENTIVHIKTRIRK